MGWRRKMLSCEGQLKDRRKSQVRIFGASVCSMHVKRGGKFLDALEGGLETGKSAHPYMRKKEKLLRQ
jgi:hypothetical protein